jgi:AcrR family transcriptional regulator
LARRLEIIEGTLELWERTSYAELTMSQVAEKLNLAKGTLYLYFPSKEELFLAVYIGLLDQWFDKVEIGIEDLHPPTAKGLANVLVEELVARPNLARLIPLVAGSLERNITVEAAKEYKHWLVKRLDRLGDQIEERVPGLPPGTGSEACLYFHALAAGLGPMGDPVLAHHDLNNERDLAKLRVDFAAALKEGFTAILVGFQNKYREPRSRATDR